MHEQGIPPQEDLRKDSMLRDGKKKKNSLKRWPEKMLTRDSETPSRVVKKSFIPLAKNMHRGTNN